jgi:acyl carrier protein
MTIEENRTQSPDGGSILASNVELVVRQITVQTLMLEDVAPEDIDRNTKDFLIDLGGTSIDALELIVSVEERFGIEFPDSQLNAQLVETLAGFVKSVCEKLEAKAGGGAESASS